MKPYRSLLPVIAALVAVAPVFAQETIFSGPQIGEKTPPFKIVQVVGVPAPREAELLREAKGPTVLVFWGGIERSMLPLLRVVDQYAFERKDRLTLHHVVLPADRIESEQRVPLVQQSLRLGVPPVLSADGAEGPGSYGLNKKCLMTLLVAKEGKVTANFALVQPGIADAPRVLKAMADVIGDAEPPKVEELEARWMASRGGRGAPARPMRQDTVPPPPTFDLTTEKGLRDAVAALQAEVIALRRELTALKAERGGAERPAAMRDTPPTRDTPRPELPGAAPTDPKLLGLLRSFIQPTNTDARVDEVLKEVREYVSGKPDLTRQAIDGWVRVLYLKYGTPYAQTAGKTFVDNLKK